jgi:DNA invertase Pin-like site-specific DNA recombinase
MTPTGILIGYARVSTLDQNPELQLDALTAAGCERIFTDRASGAKTDRPQLAAAMDYLRRDDTLCVWRLDRLGRSLPHLIEIASTLTERGVALRSLTEQIDTASAGGRLVFHLFGALAEFERALIQERTLAGLQAARARGRIGGRPSVMNPRKLALGRRMIDAVDPDGRPTYGYGEIAAALRVSRSTVVRHLTGVSQPRASTSSDT